MSDELQEDEPVEPDPMEPGDEQGDSRGVGAIHWNLFRDSRYLDACESGDLHTAVAQAAFPNVAWSSNDHKENRVLADKRFYREFSYRDAAKRLGHGSNYQGQPDKMSLRWSRRRMSSGAMVVKYADRVKQRVNDLDEMARMAETVRKTPFMRLVAIRA
jgi:hypothetical protein